MFNKNEIKTEYLRILRIKTKIIQKTIIFFFQEFFLTKLIVKK